MKKIEELKEVSGGGHIDMKDVEALKYGDILVIEPDVNSTVVAKCMYLGEHGDYRIFSHEALTVKILEIYDQTYVNTIVARPEEKDDIFESYHKSNPIRVGEEVIVSRWNLDLASRVK